MDERFVVPLLYHKVCVVVEGRAIRLHTAEEGSEAAPEPQS